MVQIEIIIIYSDFLDFMLVEWNPTNYFAFIASFIYLYIIINYKFW